MKRHSRFVAVGTVAVLSWATAPPAAAWGPTGHRAVGRIAERHLTPEAARAVRDLLGSEQLAYVTTWADEVRSEPRGVKAEAWHWVTIPDGQTYEATPKNPEGDILEAIARMEKVLGERTAPRLERTEALKWLSHLIGDLHQPLHVGRGDDRGGNDVLVSWFGEPTNLHAVWDSKVIENSQLSFSELADLADHPTAEEVRSWQASRPGDWARESQELRPACYAIGDRRLSYRYIYEVWPIMQRRIAQAGVRLAGELNRLLGSAAVSTTRSPARDSVPTRQQGSTRARRGRAEPGGQRLTSVGAFPTLRTSAHGAGADGGSPTGSRRTRGGARRRAEPTPSPASFRASGSCATVPEILGTLSVYTRRLRTGMASSPLGRGRLR